MAELKELLFNFDWLQTKLEATDGNALIADYDYIVEEELRLIQSAIRLSAHVLVRAPHQLAGQLIGRLLGSEKPEIRALVSGLASGERHLGYARYAQVSLLPAAHSSARSMAIPTRSLPWR